MIPGGRALAIGAHPDDVEFGCFGMLQTFSERRILVLSHGERGGDPEQRMKEARQAAGLIDAGIDFGALPDTQVELRAAAEVIERTVRDYRPDVVFTMSENDTHQDHHAVARASYIALRRTAALVLAYATPSNAERFRPQAIFELSSEAFHKKMEAVALHQSQQHRRYLSREFIESIGRYWSAAAGLDATYVEAFEVVKWIDVLAGGG